MIAQEHVAFLKQAVALSSNCLIDHNGGPFGAIIVKHGKIIASAVNEVLGTCDPTAHAEVQAIRKASSLLKTHDLSGTVIYSSCEPCPMCLSAIYWARIDAIYFANTRSDAADIGFDDDFLYKEIIKPPIERKIPSYQVNLAEAKLIFKNWFLSDQKRLY